MALFTLIMFVVILGLTAMVREFILGWRGVEGYPRPIEYVLAPVKMIIFGYTLGMTVLYADVIYFSIAALLE